MRGLVVVVITVYNFVVDLRASSRRQLPFREAIWRIIAQPFTEMFCIQTFTEGWSSKSSYVDRLRTFHWSHSWAGWDLHGARAKIRYKWEVAAVREPSHGSRCFVGGRPFSLSWRFGSSDTLWKKRSIASGEWDGCARYHSRLLCHYVAVNVEADWERFD